MKRSSIATMFLTGLLALAASGATMAHRMGDDDDHGYGGHGMMGGQGMMQGGQAGPGMMGPGMMGPGTMGPGMMGPGTMGSGMMGPGMMGSGMMGPGMMGSGMMSPGMMGPGMMSPGMMQGGVGPYASGVLGLDDGQRERLEAIQRENAREHWQLMQEMHEHARAMMELRTGDEVDPEALGRAFDEVAAVHRRMLVQQARMHNRMRDVLTEEQRERLRQMWSYGQ